MMRLSFRTVFAFLELFAVALGDDCLEHVYEALKDRFRDVDRSDTACQVLDGEIVVGDRIWTGVRFRDRYLFFSGWQCHSYKADSLVSYLGHSIHTCGNLYGFDTDCLRKYNREQCRRVVLEYGNATIDATSTEDRLYGHSFYVSGYVQNTRKVPVSRDDESSGTALYPPGTKVPSINQVQDHRTLGFCEPFETFFRDYCYSLRIPRYVTKAESDDNPDDEDLLPVIINSTKVCPQYHPDALSLAVESTKEVRFVSTFVKNYKLKTPIILTSGIKEVDTPGKWLGWNMTVDEDMLKCKTDESLNGLGVYVITNDGGNITWHLVSPRSLLESKHTGRQWLVICKRLYNPGFVESDYRKKCLRQYRKSRCYKPFTYVNYCCAVDENNEIWFGCPSEITVRAFDDGSECAWNCADDGLFVPEFPICRRKVACETQENAVTYAAAPGRHATMPCRFPTFGYVRWFCNSSSVFEGFPVEICCKENSMCHATDPHLNIWMSCRDSLATKRVTCPPYSLNEVADASWYCLKNLTFNGTYPDYSNCNKTKYGCKKTDKYDRLWLAASDTLVHKGCPGMRGMCYWKCNRLGKFETHQPDCSKCRGGWVEKLSEMINNSTDYKEAMEILKNHTRVHDLTIGFSHVLNLTSVCVDMYQSQMDEGNKTAFNDFLTEYSIILKNLAGQPEIWSNFLDSRRIEYGHQIIRTTQNASFAFLNVTSGKNLDSHYNGTFADFEKDGFDFFVQYGCSLLGTKYPMEKHSDREWLLEVKDIDSNSSSFAAMGLIMNHPMNYLMFPLQNEAHNMQINAPAVTFSVATATADRIAIVPNVSVFVTFKHLNETRYPETRVIRRRLHPGEQPSGIYGKTSCQYFRFTDWSDRGCKVESTTRTTTICTCSHLSTIGLLMSLHHYEPDNTLEMISLISSGITIVALILTLVAFFAFDTLRNDRVLIGVNLCVCLTLGHVLLITVMDKRFFYISDSMCTIYGIALHYAFMAAFSWMFVEGCHLYRMLVLVFESNIEFRFIYLLIGYGMPLLIVGLTEVIGIVFREQPYGQDELCWLKTPNYVWAFNGPVFLLTSINFIILIMAMKLAVASKKRTERSNLSNFKIWLKGWISLSVLLGVTWLFGLAYTHENQVLAYIFVILNGLQGLFIFVFRCICNQQYRAALARAVKSWCPNSDQMANYSMNFENVKLGSKVFAITQSGIKSSGYDSDGSALNLTAGRNRKKGGRIFKFDLFKSRGGQGTGDGNAVGDKETSSGIDVNFDESTASSRQGTLRRRLSTDHDDGDGRGSRRIWWTDGNDFPELSYHTNHFLNWQ